jgi:hypothetical protein
MIPGPFVVGRLLKSEGTKQSALALYFVLAAFGLLPVAIIGGFARDIEEATFGASRKNDYGRSVR